MIAGSFDNISKEGSYEFANMKATSKAETEITMGREPTEMSRPATTSRAGKWLDISIKQIANFSFISSWNLKYAALDFKLFFLAYMLHRVLVSISL